MIDDLFEIYQTIEELGETIKLTNSDGEEISLKASFNPQVSGGLSAAEKEFVYRGVMNFPDDISIEVYRGNYFIRENEPQSKYLLISTKKYQSPNYNIAEVVVYKCNEKVDIVFSETVYEEGSYKPVNTVVYSNVDVLLYTNLKASEQTDIGVSVRSNNIIVLPATYRVNSDYKVRKKEYKISNIKSKVSTIYDYQNYNIDSIDMSMMNSYDDISFWGTIECYLTKGV